MERPDEDLLRELQGALSNIPEPTAELPVEELERVSEALAWHILRLAPEVAKLGPGDVFHGTREDFAVCLLTVFRKHIEGEGMELLMAGVPPMPWEGERHA